MNDHLKNRFLCPLTHDSHFTASALLRSRGGGRIFRMGCASSKIDPQEKEATQQNAKIERQLRVDKKNDARTVKILLLGL